MKVINLHKPANSHQISAYAGEITKQVRSKKIAGKKIIITAKLHARKRLIIKRENVLAVHRKCEHVYTKRLIRLKKTGKLIASRLPPKFFACISEKLPPVLGYEEEEK
jgi:hypothetical protein